MLLLQAGLLDFFAIAAGRSLIFVFAAAAGGAAAAAAAAGAAAAAHSFRAVVTGVLTPLLAGACCFCSGSGARSCCGRARFCLAVAVVCALCFAVAAVRDNMRQHHVPARPSKASKQHALEHPAAITQLQKPYN